eukprot:scaffold671955_cov48-Prasinocladus_malaysianus.AAC.1
MKKEIMQQAAEQGLSIDGPEEGEDIDFEIDENEDFSLRPVKDPDDVEPEQPEGEGVEEGV